MDYCAENDHSMDNIADDNAASNENQQISILPPLAPVLMTNNNVSIESVASRKRKLETPLAAMLPEKYANADVRQFFPDFRVGKTLRFSRIFGLTEPAFSRIWRPLKKRKKRSKVDEQSAGQSKRKERYLWLNNTEVEKDTENKKPVSMRSKVADWRFGPAQLWYDMLNVSETGEGFDYGFKQNEIFKLKSAASKTNVPDETFLMVAQVTWEDDIVWDDSIETRRKVMQNINSKTNAAGWLSSSRNSLPQGCTRSTRSIATSVCNINETTNNRVKLTVDEYADDSWYSMLPVENEELVYGVWEDEIIWDSDAVSQIPRPKILTLDPNDENIILGVPDDVDLQKQRSDNVTSFKMKIIQPHVKKSKLLLGKADVVNVLENDTPSPSAKSLNQDPFNVSNDSYYLPRSSETFLKLNGGGGNLIRHSTPVVELRTPFVQPQMGPIRLRNFHRPPLKRYSKGAIARPVPHTPLSLTEYIEKKAKLREQECVASGGGAVFFMRTPEDLTGRDGKLILIEFCEEYPPLINQVGMCSKIKNYYKRKASKEEGPTHFRYGETAYAHTSSFLGALLPGESMQVVENNMYRAPIYEHKIPETDFLVLRTRHQYYIREFDALFTAGQLCPLYEVPSPTSKRAIYFVRDLMQVFIYRLFWKSGDTPKRIRIEDLRRIFPFHSENVIRKRLKQCADFKRTGISRWWVIKPDFRLPSEEEIRSMVSPEQCCAYFSMIAAEQRLKDAGYGEKFLLTLGDDETSQLKMDDEIKVAPWNTTKAFIEAMEGKCLLQLTGPADPTGCGEGFSYVRIPNIPTARQSKKYQKAQPKRLVVGTDADLRRLSVKNAKALLCEFGLPEEEIKKLSRWEVIDVVRMLSTEKSKAGEDGMAKFSRRNSSSFAEHQERYKEECQRIFDLQNRVLSSCEVLSTDEGESSYVEDDSDIEEMGRNIENMLTNKKTSIQLSLEREEQERQKLHKMVLGNNSKQSKGRKNEDDLNEFSNNQTGRILKIYRTFHDPEGNEYTRTEIVREQAVIDAYVKIRTTRDEGFIKQFAATENTQKEEMKREKRLIQEQLRRIKRNREKKRSDDFQSHSDSRAMKRFSDGVAANATSIQRRRSVKINPDIKLKCGACGAKGHMRTNRACPQYQSNVSLPPLPVATTQEQENEVPKELNEKEENLVNVDGTKVKISRKLIERAEDVRRQALLLKVPRDVLSRKRKCTNEVHCDYLEKYRKPVNRRRTDPLVVLSSTLEAILKEMRSLPSAQEFLLPVNAKKVPDYYNIVTLPMDLQTIRENIRQKKYQTRKDFLGDVNQIYENSALYNGIGSILTKNAKRLLDLCCQRLTEKEDKLMKLETAINPLLDDDDQVALSFILASIVEKLKDMPESWAFVKPVSKNAVKDYYDIIKHPMELETICNSVKAHKYRSRKEFLRDVELILNNCILYNGRDSPFVDRAEKLFRTAQMWLDEYDEHLTTLEQNIKMVQERAQVGSPSSLLFDGDDDQNQKSLHSSPVYSKSQYDFGDVMDADANDKNYVKTETQQLLADDLYCSSENDEADDNTIEELKDNSDDPSVVDFNETRIAAAKTETSTLNSASELDPIVDDSNDSVSLRDKAAENENFDNDFRSCHEDVRIKRYCPDLMSNLPEEANTLLVGLEIGDSNDKNCNVKERNIDVPEKMVFSGVPEIDDDDLDDLWF